MSDNVTLNPGVSGDSIGADDIGGVKYQRVKLIHGADGVNAGDVSQANGLPVIVTGSGSASTLNTTTTPLGGAATFTGTAEHNSASDVMVSCFSDTAGTLYLDFSVNGTDWRTFPTAGFAVSANSHEFHTSVKGPRYFRVRFVNAGGAQSIFQLFTYYGDFRQPSAPLNQSISSDSDSIITRSIIAGQTDSGDYKLVPVTPEGHLEVAVHSPRLPFGALHTESLTPIFQSDAVYGLNSGQTVTTTALSGTATASDSLFVVSTGVTSTALASIQSRKRLRYRPGQSVVGRFAGRFTTPVTYSYQVMGFGHPEDGVYFGYREATGNGYSGVAPAFGIFHIERALREVRTLTITTASSTTENVTITLNGVAFSVAVTNSGNIQRTVWEISQGVYAGWDAYAHGATVVFVRGSAQSANAGAYTLAATSAIGTFARTRAGAAGTETFIPQSTWNGDKLDGTGSSGVTIDPTLGNVYEIGIEYLGFGAIVFKVEVVPDNSNDATFVTVHTLRMPNTRLTTTFGNPSFPFTMAAYSAGSTTDLAVRAGSFAGFGEGAKILHGNRFSYFNQLTTVGATNFQCLFTIMNRRYYGGMASQVVINLTSVSGALKHTSPCIFYLIKNGSLAGNPNFQTLSSNSASVWDTAATTVTYATGDQVVWTGHLGDTGEIDHHFGGTSSLNLEELTLQPGEWITLAARAVTGTPSYVTGSINTREDQ